MAPQIQTGDLHDNILKTVQCKADPLTQAFRGFKRGKRLAFLRLEAMRERLVLEAPICQREVMLYR